MPSMRPSQYAMQQRIDDGPFLLFEREEYLGEFEEDVPSPRHADSGFEPEEDIKDYGISRIFYSDVRIKSCPGRARCVGSREPSRPLRFRLGPTGFDPRA